MDRHLNAANEKRKNSQNSLIVIKVVGGALFPIQKFDQIMLLNDRRQISVLQQKCFNFLSINGIKFPPISGVDH